jgi:hypothetical protein
MKLMARPLLPEKHFRFYRLRAFSTNRQYNQKLLTTPTEVSGFFIFQIDSNRYFCRGFITSQIAFMKNTPFTQKHIALGAKMAEFAGYNMPISYTGINDEHAAVRKNAGVFDVSHMGEFILKGEHALDLIQRVTSNDASKLTAGKAQYSCLPNENGGIIDDLLFIALRRTKCICSW